MVRDWATVSLESLVEHDRAISYGIVQPGAPVSDGVSIVRVTDVRGGRISVDEPLKVSRDIEASYARTRLSGGELLLTLVGTVGEMAIVPESLRGWNVARAVAVIPLRPDIDPYWVQIALKAPPVRHMINSRLNTTVQATLNLRDVARLPVILPPQGDRQRITRVLRTLDDKIELNRRMNETLETLAQSLFQEWFVAPTRNALPEGWREGKVSDLATLGRETVNPGEFPDETFDHFSIPAFDEGRTPKTEIGDSIKSNKFVVSPDCVLLSKLNPRIPRVWLPDLRGLERAVCSTEFLVALPKTGVSREFLFCLFSSAEFARVFATLVTGTSGSHQRVTPESLLGMDAVIPPASVVEQFTGGAKPLLERIKWNIRESRTLAALRDALLPRLLSGEIRIKEAGGRVDGGGLDGRTRANRDARAKGG
jgi:type I restriction enzyme S subunit